VRDGTPMTRTVKMVRSAFLGGVAAAALDACAGGKPAPVRIGVSGPFGGADAAYGRTWRKAMDLAAAAIPTVGGRELQLTYEDSQSEPQRAIAIAQKFIDDPSVLIELGDFRSEVSMAASPLYAHVGLVQFAFSASDPAFTTLGDCMFSTATPAGAAARALAAQSLTLGRNHAVLYRDDAFGRTASAAYVASVRAQHGSIAALQSYSPSADDLSESVGAVRDARPDVLAFFSDDTDGARVVQLAHGGGLNAHMVTSSACYTRRFLRLAGRSAEGVILSTPFFAGDRRPAVRAFVAEYSRKYGEEPDLTAASAYDAVGIAAWALARGKFTRDGTREALVSGSGIPSVVDGPFEFEPNRRVAREHGEIFLVVRNGAFVPLNPR